MNNSAVHSPRNINLCAINGAGVKLLVNFFNGKLNGETTKLG